MLADSAETKLTFSGPAPRRKPVEESPFPKDMAAFLQRLQVLFGSRFQVIKPIAIGGMATIVQLRHGLHHGLLVAKVLHSALSDRPEVVSAFRAEAVHLARLAGHPNIVPVFDFAEMDGLFYMLMPYIEGEDLDCILKRSGALPEREALMMASQLAGVLAHAELHGVTHCDISPGNIRLDCFGFYRLLDFGISRSSSTVRQQRALGGTPLYASPEQTVGHQPDIRSDIYSLGVVLYEALTGETLLSANSLDELARKCVSGEWKLPKTLPGGEAVATLLSRMLATRPEERFASAYELSGALAAYGYPRPEFRALPAERSAKAPAEPRKRRLSDAPAS